MQKEVKTLIIEVNGIPTEFYAFLGYEGTKEYVVVCIMENGVQKNIIRLALKFNTLISLPADKKIDEGISICKERGYFNNILEIMESGIAIEDFF